MFVFTENATWAHLGGGAELEVGRQRGGETERWGTGAGVGLWWLGCSQGVVQLNK